MGKHISGRFLSGICFLCVKSCSKSTRWIDDRSFLRGRQKEHMQGKVIKGIGGFYYVHDGIGRIYECKARGIFRNRNVKLLVGDNVEFEILNEEEGLGNVTEILPRKNVLARPSAANVEQAVIMFACREPEPNFGLLDRFLIRMDLQDLPVVLVFGKADLADEAARQALRDIYRNTGYPMLFLSTQTGEGMEQFSELLEGKTTILAGPSGVGKTSLRNLFVKESEGETGALSRKLMRGKHTTRHTEIFRVRENTYLLDTPGFTALTLSEAESQNCREYFPEFMPFWNECRFQGCVHMEEPGCRIKQAVEEGAISPERYASYRQLYLETKEMEKRKY